MSYKQYGKYVFTIGREKINLLFVLRKLWPNFLYLVLRFLPLMYMSKKYEYYLIYIFIRPTCFFVMKAQKPDMDLNVSYKLNEVIF